MISSVKRDDPPDNVVLIGFMGSGKTTVGEELAQLTGWRFIDLDQCICQRAGRSIPEIFAGEGEGAFRTLETDALRSLREVSGCIIATGGGAVGQAENWSLMRSLGPTVFLDVSWQNLVSRISAQGGRPLANGQDGWELVRKLLEERLPLYTRADFRIDCGTGRPAEIAEKIARQLGLIQEQE